MRGGVLIVLVAAGYETTYIKEFEFLICKGLRVIFVARKFFSDWQIFKSK
jgi:hypothetical protein